jgi:hypothetical protein
MKVKRRQKRELSGAGLMTLALLSSLVLMLAPAGLVSAQGWGAGAKNPVTGRAAQDGGVEPRKKIPDLKVAAQAGSFSLRNLELVKSAGSSKLRGEVSNETRQRWQRATFELKAFDDRGKELRGAEEMTIFQVSDFAGNASVPLDGDFGVRLEGIPFEAVSRIEAVLIEGRLPAAYKFELQQAGARDDLKFEDEALSINFDIGTDAINLVLLGKGGRAAEIDWGGVKFVDPSGETLVMRHRDVSLSHGVLAPLSKIALPENSIPVTLSPDDATDKDRALTGATLLPEDAWAINYKGKSISLLLPVRTNGARKSYRFVFKITDVEAGGFRLAGERYQFLDNGGATRLDEREIEE